MNVFDMSRQIPSLSERFGAAVNITEETIAVGIMNRKMKFERGRIRTAFLTNSADMLLGMFFSDVLSQLSRGCKSISTTSTDMSLDLFFVDFVPVSL
jgi:hypothetical protein